MRRLNRISDGTPERDRVYITGLSAGAAMTDVILATYPEVFSAGAMISGLPYGAATGPWAAALAMLFDSGIAGRDWGDRVREPPNNANGLQYQFGMAAWIRRCARAPATTLFDNGLTSMASKVSQRRASRTTDANTWSGQPLMAGEWLSSMPFLEWPTGHLLEPAA